jgi:hypothetical protein
MDERRDNRTRRRLLALFILAWQGVVVLLIYMGSMRDAYGIMGVSWEATGIKNTLATAAGFLLHEIPAIAAAICICVWR